MIPQRPHPRRTAPSGVPFPRRTLRCQDAQIRLPEDSIHEAGRSPVALHVEFHEDEESDSPPRGQGTSRGVYGSQPPIPLQGDEPSLPTRQESDEDRLIRRNIEVFRRRLRAGLLAPVYHHSQQTRRRPLLFQDMEQPSRQSRRHPRTHLIPLPSAPQADPFRPPPSYSPRNPRLHPTGEDYDLTSSLYHRLHNNGAPPLPVYTPVAGPSERVLQFGGSEYEQRNALLRLLQERNRQEREREEAMEEIRLLTWEEVKSHMESGLAIYGSSR
ncbi:hypothetical protein B0H65DRAFT_530258 [Neurospora tetraspora]|uniref:Uncharacterized protein n=1 Tax=Neurospora tetraspora TaxID=94610 RepID=A0AAE0JBM2_9PEZI|nr:hypothetical protein B0H65DRAFT_530258 [Neurospora tetraspora]